MDFLIHHMLETSTRRVPDKDALIHRNDRLTYRDVSRRVSGLAAGLMAAGIQRGDRVGIHLDASVPQALSLFAISRAHGVFVPINSLLFPEQVAHIARDCQMKALITSASKLSSLAAIVPSIPSLEFLVVVGDREPGGAPLRVLAFAELCQRDPGPGQADLNIETDLAAILYTSGSTGKPKGVMLTNANIVAGSSIVSTYLEISERDRILAVLPFSFDAGLNQIMTAFQQSATIVLINFVLAREIVTALVTERITGLAGVPTLWNLLAQPSSTLDRQPLPDLRYITNTGGVMPQNVLQILRRVLPATKVYLMYGLTEAFRSTYLPPEEIERRPTSIGRAIPDTEILVIDDGGRPCKPGDVGELVHRGPTVSMGYWGQPELTARVLRPHPLLPPELGAAERVCYSGDYVTTDEDGYLYFVGRRDTMIKSSGFRISPTEVEEVIHQSGMVRGAAVIGIPDEILGQAIKAFVVSREGHEIDLAELERFCSSRMPRHMIPRSFAILDDLPRTTSGKVDYPALRRREGV